LLISAIFTIIGTVLLLKLKLECITKFSGVLQLCSSAALIHQPPLEKTIFFRETRSVYMKNIHSKVLHYDPKNFFKNPCATYFKASILCQEMQGCKDFLTNQRFSLCHNSVVCPMSGIF
jgi:hypothetical protein